MNRYTNLSFSNLRDLRLPALPIEQLDSLLASQQKQIDTSNKLLNLTPKYIQESEGDVKLAGEISTWQKQVKDRLFEIAKSGKTSDYLSALNQVNNEVVNLYSPGGAANTLESRYAAYKTEQERINKATEKYTNPIYKPFFESQLKKQLEDKNIYNKDTRAGKQISPVNIFGEINVGEEIDKYFKDWAKTKNVDIRKWIDGSGKVNPYYFEKYSIEGISAKELQNSLQFFYNQPQIQQALGVESWNIKRNLDPLQQSMLVTQAEQARSLKLESAKQQELANLQVLESKKDTKDVQQIVEQAGYKTFEEYKENVLKSINDAELLVTTMPLDIDEVVMDSIKKKYTNAYVPKYAFTDEDRSLIVNQPAIEMLRHHNKQKQNKQMLQGLETLYKNPDSEFFQSEVDAFTVNSQGLLDNFKDARGNFERSNNLINTPQYAVLKGVFTGINNKSDTEQLMLVKEAAKVATKDGKVDPVAFAKHINDNGGSVSSDGATKMVEYLDQPEIRTQIESYLDVAKPAYENFNVVNDQVKEAVANQDDGFWESIARRKGYLSPKNTSPSPAGDKGVSYRPSESEEKITNAISKVKQEYQNGELEPNLLSEALPEEVQTNSAVTMFYNPAMKPLYDNLTKGLSSTIHSLIKQNILTLTTDQLKSMGYNEKGEYVGDSGNPIENVNTGIRTIDGKKEMVYIVNGKYGDKPVILQPNQLSDNFNKGFLLNAAAQTLNPDNFGEVINEQVFNDVSSIYFDQNISTNLNTSRIQAAMQNNRSVGSFREPITGVNVKTRVVEDTWGQKYLVGVTEEAEKKLEMYRDGNRYRLSNFFEENKEIPASQHILNSANANDVLRATTELKADWAKPAIQYELIKNPDKVKTSRTNITSQMQQGINMLYGGGEIFNDDNN